MAVRSPFFTRTPHAASLPRRGARSCTLLFVYEILSNNAFTASAFLCESGDKITAFELSRQIFPGLFFEFFRGKEVNGLISEGKAEKVFQGKGRRGRGRNTDNAGKAGISRTNYLSVSKQSAYCRYLSHLFPITIRMFRIFFGSHELGVA
jgi:hypothetical protein